MSLTQVLDSLAGYARDHGDDIVVRVRSRWISVSSKKAEKIFAELRPSKERIEIFLLPPPKELGNGALVSRPPPSQGWGWFRSKLYIKGDMKSALRLLRISYIFVIRGDGRRSKRR